MVPIQSPSSHSDRPAEIERTKVKEGNQYLHARLKGIQQILMGAHSAGELGSSASKGADREFFVNMFLKNVLPPQFRFGSGDITDLAGRTSGQLDLVVEFPIWPSLQVPGGGSRLYFAEGVAAVIEVKSDLAAQWGEVERTSRKLARLRRLFGSTHGGAPWSVPVFAVGYTGWKDIETLRKYVSQRVVDGILIIENGLFAWDGRVTQTVTIFDAAQGPWALWAFITAILRVTSTLKHTSTDPGLYARPDLILLNTLSIRKGEQELIEVFETTDNLGLERPEVSNLLECLREDGLVVIGNSGSAVSITQKGRDFLGATFAYQVPFW